MSVTDADGVSDGVDPTPLAPGVPESFLEFDSRELSTVAIPSLELSLFSGPNASARKGRRNALAEVDIETTIEELESMLEKIDGEPTPPDWMNASPERDALRAEVELVIDLPGLE